MPLPLHPSDPRCPRCGDALPIGNLSGNCPRCLAALVFSAEPPPEPASAPPPRVIRYLGDYELETEVARGGMGVVFRARQVSLDRIVAIKLMRDGALATPEDVRRFRGEAANAAKLNHPNIVAVHEVGQQDGHQYFAMDLVEGANLAELTRQALLPPRQAAELVAKVALAVQHAHQQGVLHRDLKPSNVLVDADGEPQVTDFGLALPLDGRSDLTQSGQVLGTPGYMAPEQARGGATVGPAADVYGLGAVLFHLLTGRAPFVGAGAAETLAQVLASEPLSPRLLNPAVPVDLAAVCQRCLAKEPERRYGSAREVAEDLRRFLRGEPTVARPAGVVERLWRWCLRERALASAIAAAHLVGLLGVVGILWQWRAAVMSTRVATAATREKAEQLWLSQLLDAKFYRLNGGFGQRTRDLEAIAQAASYRPSLELRNEAIAALVLPDVGTNLWWHAEDNPVMPSAFSRDLEYFVSRNRTGHVTVCRAADQQAVAELEAPAADIAFSEFSPDARWVAARFRDGAVRVWDWRTTKLALAASSWPDQVGLPTFDFTPDSRELWLTGSDSRLQRFGLPDGRPLPLPTAAVSGMGVRLDPSGQRLLAFEEKAVAAWDVTTGVRQGTWTLDGQVWRAAWHPQGREFAIGTYGAGVFVGEMSGTNLDLLEGSAPGLAAASMGFTPDGSTLLVGGWGNVFAAWNFASRKPALRSSQACFAQLRADGQQVALYDEHRGYGVREYVHPVGIRRSRAGLPVSGVVSAVAWHPSGEWLIVGHSGGWSVWNRVGDGLRLSRQTRACQSVQFLRNGHGFLTGGGEGPLLWPFGVVAGQPQVGEPRRLLPEDAGANERAALSPDGTRFAAVGRYGAFIGAIVGGAPPVPLPGGVGDCYVAYSEDGRWIQTGAHNGRTIHIHSAETGAWVTNIASGTGAVMFFPGHGELATSGPSELNFWQVGTWHQLRSRPIPHDASGGEFVGFWPDGSCALASGRDWLLRLWDPEANREIACLQLPEGSAAWAGVFDPTGQFMATTSSYPFLRVWDFPALRRELARLGLDWPGPNPSVQFAPRRE